MLRALRINMSFSAVLPSPGGHDRPVDSAHDVDRPNVRNVFNAVADFSLGRNAPRYLLHEHLPRGHRHRLHKLSYVNQAIFAQVFYESCTLQLKTLQLTPGKVTISYPWTPFWSIFSKAYARKELSNIIVNDPIYEINQSFSLISIIFKLNIIMCYGLGYLIRVYHFFAG